MENVFELKHPLIQHKISKLRDKHTGTNEFRKLVEEIAMLMGFEALSDLPLEDIEVETPIETCKTPVIAGKTLAVVPILRAGLGMVNGILALVSWINNLVRSVILVTSLQVLFRTSSPITRISLSAIYCSPFTDPVTRTEPLKIYSSD